MRIHRLEFEGIGSYPGKHTIDFDELNAAGLFVIEGDTGSGKSTIIDAIVFALYQKVALGRESSLDRLRCDYADPEKLSWVQLDFSTAKGMYRVWRSPKQMVWSSRKKALVTRQASVRLFKLSGTHSCEEGEALGVKSQEVEYELRSINRLSYEQFLQTVILPQGHFSRFLKATSDEREELLQQVFGTQFFKVFQDRLAAKAFQISKEVDDARKTITILANDYRDSLAVFLHDDPLDDCDSITFETLFEQLITQPDIAHLKKIGNLIHPHINRIVTDAKIHKDTAKALAKTAQNKRDSARELMAAQKERAQLLEEEQSLAAEKPRIDDAALRSENARKAAFVFKAHNLLTDNAQILSLALRRLISDCDELARFDKKAQQRYGELRPDRDHCDVVALSQAIKTSAISLPLDNDSVAELSPLFWLGNRHAYQRLCDDSDSLAQQLGVLKNAIEKEKQRDALLKNQKDTIQERETLHALIDKVNTDEKAIDATIVSAQKAVDKAEKEHHHAEKLRCINDDNHEKIQAARQLCEEYDKQKHLEKQLKEAEKELLDARAHYSQVLDCWKNNTAASLAHYLQEEAPCPVCGSCEHPHVAKASKDEATLADVASAREYVGQKETACHEIRHRLDESCQRQTDLTTVLHGDNPHAVLESYEERIALLHQLGDSHEKVVQARKDLEVLRTQQTEYRTQIIELNGKDAVLLTRQTDLSASIDDLTGSIKHARAEFPSVEARIEHFITLRRHLDNVREGLDSVDQATHAVIKSAYQEYREAIAQDFCDVSQALDAHIDDEDYERLVEMVTRYQQRITHVRSRLEHPRITQCATQKTPDLDYLERHYDECAHNADSLRDYYTQCYTHRQQVGEREEKLLKHLDDYIKRLCKQRPLLRLSELAKGSKANKYGTPLATWVLLARLDDVLAIANPMIRRISGGQYELIRSDRDGSQSRNQALSLDIMNFEADKPRKISTVSGGETFYCSLCLALALTQVVAAEAGGISIDTMFIDEGFGTLDHEKLDALLNELSGPDYHGRGIGIITHVDTVRERMSERVSVTKRADGKGSTLRVIGT
ncbi:MAG: SMC family ATPase [Actinomycetaceae bacterium]|nr:SMC family ATPase [Actinomycetaceae bacterium]